MEINQFLPGVSLGDATTHFAEELQSIMLDGGMCEKSGIYSDFKHTPPLYQGQFKSFLTYQGNPENIAIYHFGIGSEITDYFKQLPDKKILVYHNITPEKFFRFISPDKVDVLKQGTEQIKSLITCVDRALGVSRYNEKDLSQLGFTNTGVLPLVLDEAYFSGKADKNILNSYDNNQTKLIAVGRIAPNKKLEDVVKIFYYYQKLIDPDSWLFLVGSYGGMLNYCMYIRSLIEALNLKNVIFTGHISHEQLLAYYQLADVFVTMSEHEGFCIPVLEAFHFNVPVIAYASSAIPETVNDAGILVHEKNHAAIAEMMYEVISTPELVNSLRQKGRKRLQSFTKELVAQQLKEILASIMV